MENQPKRHTELCLFIATIALAGALSPWFREYLNVLGIVLCISLLAALASFLGWDFALSRSAQEKLEAKRNWDRQVEIEKVVERDRKIAEDSRRESERIGREHQIFSDSVISRVPHVSAADRNLLLEYLPDSSSKKLNTNDPRVLSLVKEKMVYQDPAMPVEGDFLFYKIQPWLLEHLKKIPNAIHEEPPLVDPAEGIAVTTKDEFGHDYKPIPQSEETRRNIEMATAQPPEKEPIQSHEAITHPTLMIEPQLALNAALQRQLVKDEYQKKLESQMAKSLNAQKNYRPNGLPNCIKLKDGKTDRFFSWRGLDNIHTITQEEEPSQLMGFSQTLCDEIKRSANWIPQFAVNKPFPGEIVFEITSDGKAKWKLLGGMGELVGDQTLVVRQKNNPTKEVPKPRSHVGNMTQDDEDPLNMRKITKETFDQFKH